MKLEPGFSQTEDDSGGQVATRYPESLKKGSVGRLQIFDMPAKRRGFDSRVATRDGVIHENDIAIWSRSQRDDILLESPQFALIRPALADDLNAGEFKDQTQIRPPRQSSRPRGSFAVWSFAVWSFAVWSLDVGPPINPSGWRARSLGSGRTRVPTRFWRIIAKAPTRCNPRSEGARGLRLDRNPGRVTTPGKGFEWVAVNSRRW